MDPPPLTVQLKRGRDGPSTLACLRADGTRSHAKLHPFQPAHDLTHLAVESVLRLEESFFGMIAAGWEIDALASPGSAARVPAQTVLTECIVALFDLERGNGEVMDAAAFNGMLEASLAGQQRAAFRIEAAELARIRALRDAALARWQALAPGATLELSFPLEARRLR